MVGNLENNKKDQQPRPDTQAAPAPVGTPANPDVLPSPNHVEQKGGPAPDVSEIIENLPNIPPSKGKEYFLEAVERGDITDITPPTSSEDYSS